MSPSRLLDFHPTLVASFRLAIAGLLVGLSLTRRPRPLCGSFVINVSSRRSDSGIAPPPPPPNVRSRVVSHAPRRAAFDRWENLSPMVDDITAVIVDLTQLHATAAS